MARTSAIGVDFGTTNSAIARADAAGRVTLAEHSSRSGPTRVYRSILYFDPEDQEPGRPAPSFTGPSAIEHYLDSAGQGRLMLSMKSHLASRSLEATMVYGFKFLIEELVAMIVRDLRVSSERHLGTLDGPVVAGRPVRFASGKGTDDDVFAVGRLRRAFRLAGFPDVRFEYEPVAAAWAYQADLDRDELVLIADFGGGTSDFCLLRVGPTWRDRTVAGGGATGALNSSGDGGREQILGTSGVGYAGDSFDAEVVDRLVSPKLGRGGQYKSLFGRELPIPAWIFGSLKRWHRLSWLGTPENLRMLEQYTRSALEPEKLAALLYVVRENLGFALYRSVEQAKVDVSGAEAAQLLFHDTDLSVQAELRRDDFEGWIAPVLERVEDSVDGLLETHGVSHDRLDRVFLTGGSAQVPAVRRLFDVRFGADKVRTGEHLTSVAHGLALAARAG